MAMGLSQDLSKGLVMGAIAGVGGYLAAKRVISALTSVETELSTTSNSHDGNVYETDRAVAEYLQFHFGEDMDLLPWDNGPKEALNFATRTADMCTFWVNKCGLPKDAAFDVGAAVGRTSFDLSMSFDRVVGLDFSHNFIKTAQKLQSKQELEYTVTMEGEVRRKLVCAAPKGANLDRITFMQGDACNLPEGLGKFSVIHGANLLCRLPDPQKFLERLPSLLVSKGLVVLISPYSWLHSYTPKDKWLGGYSTAGGEVNSFDVLTDIMEGLGFKLLHAENTPFLIREHVRKFQWGISHATVWQLQK
eukprot:CAMPEP_0182925698 /NCGR_PEP_ID=MMETSP0105_2-20130417/10108_1 /TAXON_ID=81532 ORGANISM="Acanthoeca-like sp., Strain 10tr" /NCGR_SAMPLE_ID=MMETSP0105_2 /ASSEMBLY_ACC=CAM_ASM_000205 /LENGTH=304 /DNA_ID=CAMNT_0025063557 /DNA_START=19 /DNA_END=933 /DNA_ORIENTATION=+